MLLYSEVSSILFKNGTYLQVSLHGNVLRELCVFCCMYVVLHVILFKVSFISCQLEKLLALLAPCSREQSGLLVHLIFTLPTQL